MRPYSRQCLLSCSGKLACTESQPLGVMDVLKRACWTWCEALELVMQTGLAAWGFLLQARMKDLECSRYRQGCARVAGP